jgi:ribonuclease P protein component
MLRSREDFVRVSTHGHSRADRLMVARFVPNGRDHDRFGISTGRRLGGAVARNRVRRRLREVLRRSPNQTGHGWDILLVVRPAAVTATFDELGSALERLLHAIRATAGTAT